MDISKITNEAEKAWETYKKHDPVMVRKSFAMKDVLYRKSSPGREMWHTEFSFDYDFYGVVLVLAAVLVAVCVFFSRTCSRASGIMHRMHRKHHR